jgi:hypothetical protein
VKNESRVVANFSQILKSLKDVGSNPALVRAGHDGVLLLLREVLVKHHLKIDPKILLIPRNFSEKKVKNG